MFVEKLTEEQIVDILREIQKSGNNCLMFFQPEMVTEGKIKRGDGEIRASLKEIGYSNACQGDRNVKLDDFGISCAVFGYAGRKLNIKEVEVYRKKMQQIFGKEYANLLNELKENEKKQRKELLKQLKEDRRKEKELEL